MLLLYGFHAKKMALEKRSSEAGMTDDATAKVGEEHLCDGG